MIEGSAFTIQILRPTAMVLVGISELALGHERVIFTDLGDAAILS